MRLHLSFWRREDGMIPETALLAAKRGLAWLEDAMPEAVERLDVEQLSMGSHELCVVGQTCGHFANLCDWVESGVGASQTIRWVTAHGFVDAPEHTYDDLDAAWRQVLSERAETG